MNILYALAVVAAYVGMAFWMHGVIEGIDHSGDIFSTNIAMILVATLWPISLVLGLMIYVMFSAHEHGRDHGEEFRSKVDKITTRL